MRRLAVNRIHEAGPNHSSSASSPVTKFTRLHRLVWSTPVSPEPPFETKRGSLPCPTPRRRRKPCQLSAGAIPYPGRAAANAPKSAFLRLLTDGLTLGMRHELAPTAQWVGRGKVHGGNALS